MGLLNLMWPGVWLLKIKDLGLDGAWIGGCRELPHMGTAIHTAESRATRREGA